MEKLKQLKTTSIRHSKLHLIMVEYLPLMAEILLQNNTLERFGLFKDFAQE